MKSIKFLGLLLMATVTLAGFSACSSDDDDEKVPELGSVTITLSGIDDNLQGFTVQLRNVSTNSSYTKTTDEKGSAKFSVTPGLYEATTSAKRYVDGFTYIYNGSQSQINVQNGINTVATLELKAAKTGQVIVKELYNGGCPKDDGSGAFQMDKGIVLYNNSAAQAVVSNLCFGMATPYNSNASNSNYGEDNKLVYEADGFTPAQNGIWYFPQTLTIEPYSQVVISCMGSIDNTKTYSQSVNYANAEYYCMYDPESGYALASYYPTPSDLIPESHYLKAVKFGQGTAWMLSVSSPGLIVYQTKDVTPAEHANNADNLWYSPGVQQTPVYACIKVPNEWILDAVEVFDATKVDDNVKRFTVDIDAGYVYLTNKLGHTLYRNVDKDATEALPENAGKLVYNYSLGVGTSTDPSGIDAEASIKNGAHIVYMDTNNSTFDFHERQKFSLRGE